MFSFEALLNTIHQNFLWAIGVNVPIALVSYAVGVVRGSGLIAGLAYGLVIFIFGGYQAFLMLLFFFLAGSVASKIGVARKSAAGTAEEHKGARGAGSVVGKCTVGAIIAVLLGASGGMTAAQNGISSLLELAYTGAFAAALADTLASELGPLFGKKAFRFMSFQSVSHGTPGAVSAGGTAFGLLGAVLVGILAVSLGLVQGGDVAALVFASLIAILSESHLRAAYPGQSLFQKQLPNGILTLIGALLTILFSVRGVYV